MLKFTLSVLESPSDGKRRLSAQRNFNACASKCVILCVCMIIRLHPSTSCGSQTQALRFSFFIKIINFNKYFLEQFYPVIYNLLSTKIQE